MITYRPSSTEFVSLLQISVKGQGFWPANFILQKHFFSLLLSSRFLAWTFSAILATPKTLYQQQADVTDYHNLVAIYVQIQLFVWLTAFLNFHFDSFQTFSYACIIHWLCCGWWLAGTQKQRKGLQNKKKSSFHFIHFQLLHWRVNSLRRAFHKNCIKTNYLFSRWKILHIQILTKIFLPRTLFITTTFHYLLATQHLIFILLF